MRFDHRIYPASLGAGLLFAAVSALGQVPANSPPTSTSSFPPVGLAPSETAQVNVVNTATAYSGAPAPSCTGSIAFYNASGSMIGGATSFTAGSGQISSVTLPYDAAGGSGSRTVVRAEIVLTFPATVAAAGAVTSAPPCLLSSSLETYDTMTGVTHVFLAGTQGIPIAVRSGVLGGSLPGR